jgi:flagellar biosynthesis/type III secretory pathway protein FliH
MIRKGRIVTDRQATALVPRLPVDRAQPAAWLDAVAPANMYDPFAPPTQSLEPAAPLPLDPQAAHQAMMQQLEAEMAKLKSMQMRYAEGIAKLTAQALARPASPERVLDLVLLIAREVIGREVETDPSLILEHVEQGIAALGGDEPIDVRLTASDAQLVAELKPELAQVVRFVPDESVGPGGCIVENSRRIIDSSLTEKLESVRAALADALATPPGGTSTQRKVA